VTVLLVAALVGWYLSAKGRPTADDVALVIPVGAYAPGTVRLDQGVWVSRQLGGEFMVFLDRDPHRGQRLNWVAEKGLFMQAAAYQADGRCVEGPCSVGPGMGLFRVEARLEGENLVVYPGRVISGGFNPEPAWITEFRRLFRRAEPSAPASGRP
jgi:hypothetical protein